ncbi:MAG TPA: phosphate ABC transporter ATP-binding protein PstB [Candidatus Lokiarchaeia archaeon]|nr:phosphate ABC transporter ATP-binding protein PstB [Candidatus Lokiarchaeia archaeon]
MIDQEEIRRLLVEDSYENNPKVELQVKNFSSFYGEKQVLKNLNFNIVKGAVTALIGPSGCGKSTLLKSINRMNDLNDTFRSSGEILFLGENIYDKKEDVIQLRKKIGMVFQKPNPFPMSIYDNIVFGPYVSGIPRAEWDSLVERVLDATYLWDEVKDRLHDNAYSLSGGQQQRLCIARAMSIKPDVLLMDEPCSALDPIATARIEELILELKQYYTVVIVTHSMAQARRVADYVAFLYLGELVEVEESSKFFSDPNSERSKDYICGRVG